MQTDLVLLRGGGDLASGVALRLHHAGFGVIITELTQPLAVRRTVSFSEAIYEGHVTVEDVTARRAAPEQIDDLLTRGEIPVIVDERCSILKNGHFEIVVDARLTKSQPEPLPHPVPLHIALGPGYTCGRDCDAVVETQRGHMLGRVHWSGSALPDSGQPEGDPRRVLRAPVDGFIHPMKNIGGRVEAGEIIAEIQSSNGNQKSEIASPLKGVLRGILREGMPISAGLKIGDVDPRDDPALCYLVSDKALAVGGGVLEAILTKMRRSDAN